MFNQLSSSLHLNESMLNQWHLVENAIRSGEIHLVALLGAQLRMTSSNYTPYQKRSKIPHGNRIKAAMNQHISTKPGKSLDSKTCPIFKVRNVQVIQVTQTYPKRSKNANAAGLVWGFE